MDTSLPIQAIAADVFVAPQLEADAMTVAARMGFKSVVCNRPDFEGGPDQPTSERVGQAAEAAGLQFAYLPVSGAFQSPEQIAAMAKLLENLPRPVLMYCRSGARSANLYRQASEN
jgi:uncharacterized protein (TIGR01244 family)